jgi:hypothetical protein
MMALFCVLEAAKEPDQSVGMKGDAQNVEQREQGSPPLAKELPQL